MTCHVAPAETRPARLAALAKLPIFLDLQGKRVVVAGGCDPVVWKAELLAAAGAMVSIYAEDPEPELVAIVEANGGALSLTRRAWRESDLDGAWLGVADEPEPEAAASFAAAARSRGVLANVVDNPPYCDFQFGTIVNRSPVVVGISTDGAAPILGQAIRRRIEAVLPRSLGAWAGIAKASRDRIRSLLPAKADRRRFWERFVDATFASPVPDESDPEIVDRLARAIERGADRRAGIGEVVLVGAGPGDPELLTLRAMRELQAADVVVYDRLVTPGVLELARRDARRIHVGKEGHGAACRQDEISSLLVELASSGQRVVRLKGGDPAIFGRTGEEADACREAGIPVRIVPGVTSASAAAASLTLPLTHRSHAQRIQFVTGHDRHGVLPADLDLDALADARATTVIYMGRKTAAALAQELIRRGLDATTPAVIASDVSRPTERITPGTLETLARGDGLDRENAPTLILIGSALATAASQAQQSGRDLASWQVAPAPL